ncbi:MAG: sugar ABC transporter ATP-binding protein [Desulfobacterales bacterium]|jgi:ribose transport system ATP-binding protein
MDSHSLEMIGITKTFPGVKALDRVTFSCRSGEVHALVGENGAGKSTLMKVLAGVYQPDEGQTRINGQRVSLNTPAEAQQLGLATIYQEFNLLPWLSATENILLGRLPKTKWGTVDWSLARQLAQATVDRLGICLDLRKRVIDFSVAEQQLVEIAKALSLPVPPKVLIMDEPSAVLAGQELEQLFGVIKNLKVDGVTIIYISHRLEEVFEIADRVTVMRDGRVVGCDDVANLDKQSLIGLMVGRSLDETFPPAGSAMGPVLLELQNVSSKKLGLDNVSLSVRRGEILGLAGLVGAGRTALAQVIFGISSSDSGRVMLDGQPCDLGSPRKAIRQGLALVPENRKDQGLVLGQSVRDNCSLVILDELKGRLFLDKNKEDKIVSQHVADMDIKTPSLEQEVGFLSGGNQQKVVLGKWLSTSPQLIILDEPTRGIDVRAKSEIYKLMRRLADEGTAIVMISSELQEIIGMSDRVLVMARGRVTGELSRSEATEEKIMTLAIGDTPVAACVA